MAALARRTILAASATVSGGWRQESECRQAKSCQNDQNNPHNVSSLSHRLVPVYGVQCVYLLMSLTGMGDALPPPGACPSFALGGGRGGG